jgi:hypothetical protein
VNFATAATAGGLRPCTLTTEQQVIDVAIASFIDQDGSRQRRYDMSKCAGLGGPPCVNPFPYRSREEFKQKNPDCCRISTRFEEAPVTYRSNLRGEKHPKMYFVMMKFTAFTKGEDSRPKPYLHEQWAIISCHGQSMRGDVP